MRCDNSSEGITYCGKCQSALSVNGTEGRADKCDTPHGDNRLHCGGAPGRYTVGSLPCIIHYTISKDKRRNYRVRKCGVTKQYVEELLKFIPNDKDCIDNQSTTYICPVCGSDVVVEGCPMCFGDDYEHNCLGCRNKYFLGGTRFEGFEYTSLEVLCPNPYKFAYDTMHTRCKIIAESSQKILLQYEDAILLMKDLGKEYQITDYMKLCM